MTRRIKVLHLGKFYPPHRGGMENHLHALCALTRNDVDIEVLVSHAGRRTVRETVDGVSVTRAGTALTLAGASISPALFPLLRRTQADIVHMHWPNPPAAIGYLASSHAGALVVTYHSDVVRQRVLGRLFAPLLESTMRRSAAIIATSPAYLDSSKVLRGHRDRCHVIPLGIGAGPFAPPATGEVERIRRIHGDQIVLSVGRMVSYKGYEYLIRAMAEAPGRLVIAGSGPLRGRLECLIAECGLNGRVVLVGNPSDETLRAYYHAASVFVLASIERTEAFGLVQAEAMAAGKPVINTRLDSGVPYVSLHGETGLTVPCRDAAALAAAIRTLLEDHRLREAYGQAAQQRAGAEFRAEVMAARTLELYESVMQKRAGRAA